MLQTPYHVDRMIDLADIVKGLACYPVEGYPNLYNFTYGMQDKNTFVEPMAREFRGLVMHSHTQEIVFRGFHKFFNLNEHPETMEKTLKWENLVGIDIKMDGTLIMVAEYRDKLLYKTKNSINSPITQIARKHVGDREEFLMKMTSGKWTVLFEQIYADHPADSDVVTTYKEPGLVYLCRRDNETGEYDVSMETNEAFKEAGFEILPDNFYAIIEAVANDQLIRANFLRQVSHQVGFEGLILTFRQDNGALEFVKVKTHDYLIKTKTLSKLSDRGVAELIESGKYDDAYAFVKTRNEAIARRMELNREHYFAIRQRLVDSIMAFDVGGREGRELYEFLKDHPEAKDCAYLIQARVAGRHIDYDKFMRQNVTKNFSTELWKNQAV